MIRNKEGDRPLVAFHLSITRILKQGPSPARDTCIRRDTVLAVSRHTSDAYRERYVLPNSLIVPSAFAILLPSMSYLSCQLSLNSAPRR